MNTESEPLRLNIGSGDKLTLKGYVNVDAKFGNIAYPLKYDDGTVEEIYASHILEHFPFREVPNVLKDWTRALKPGGVLKIAVPDFKWIAEKYVNGSNGAPLMSYLMGSQVDENDYHKAIFDEPKLRLELTQAGLMDIQPWESDVSDCAALPVSLNLMGRKPEVDNFTAMGAQANGSGRHFVAGEWRESANLSKERVRIRAGVVMSTPRYGPLDAAEAISEIGVHLHAPRFKSGGAFWEQGLTRAIEQALGYRDTDGEPLDVLISLDYDTFATPDDAKRLIQLLYQNPQYDCIVPLQARRGIFAEVLATTAGPVDMTSGLVPIVTGHFGLTAFRRRVFEGLKKPWLLSRTDSDGAWGDGRTDADIHFWRNFTDCGFKAAMAPGVVIGHGEDAIVYPRLVNGKIEKVYISVYEWLGERSVPENAGVIG